MAGNDDHAVVLWLRWGLRLRLRGGLAWLGWGAWSSWCGTGSRVGVLGLVWLVGVQRRGEGLLVVLRHLLAERGEDLAVCGKLLVEGVKRDGRSERGCGVSASLVEEDANGTLRAGENEEFGARCIRCS